jgi:peptide/nickel transport system substrate-binding protein
MLDIVQRDAPWIWGLHPKRFSLFHDWLKNIKPNDMANNTLKYKRIDPQLRAAQRSKWNRPIIWPLLLTVLLLVAAFVPAVVIYRRKQRSQGVQ